MVPSPDRRDNDVHRRSAVSLLTIYQKDELMKKLLCVILLSLLLVPGMAQAKRHGGHDDCRFIATADNDGTGDNRTKKRGGNYIAI